MDNQRFSIGRTVRLLHDRTNMIRQHPSQLTATYEIVRIVPGERDGLPQYHIKNDAEPHMRSVMEDQITEA
jgi:hypothetical protein